MSRAKRRTKRSPTKRRRAGRAAPRGRVSPAAAEWLSWAVAGVLGLLVLSFEVTDPWVPPGSLGRPGDGVTVWDLLWAASRRATFVPLVVAVVVAPGLTWLAARRRGRHRLGLAAAWAAASAWLVTRHGDRLWLMLEVIWWRLTR